MPSESASEKMTRIARHIEAHFSERLTLEDLAPLCGLSPSRLQKVFKSVFGVSPRAYQDGLRMRAFRDSLRDGDSVTGAIYDAGFGSVSRVYGQAERQVGMKPAAYRNQGAGERISWACRETVAGLLLMAATEKGVCLAEFGSDQESLLERLSSEFPRAELVPSAAADSPELDAWIGALDEYLGTGGPCPDLPLDLRGTAFQVQVWQCLLSIRDGEVVSYSELAARLGRPDSVRAVASACGRNRIAVLIPCHRVLRRDGSLGGYRWGLERKQRLLELERLRAAHKHPELPAKEGDRLLQGKQPG